MNINSSNPTNQREKVLVVLHADNFVEVYAKKHVDVHICQLPAMETPEGQIAAERYLDHTLPHPYRNLYEPGFRRCFDQCRAVRPSEIEKTMWELSVINVLDRIQDESDPITSWTEGTSQWTT